MIAIVLSKKGQHERFIIPGIDFLKSHPVVEWGVGFKIAKNKYNPNINNPLIGFLNVNSYIRYKIKIIEIIDIFDNPRNYINKEENPIEWFDESEKHNTILRLTLIKPIIPILTRSLIKTNREKVKREPQSYVEIQTMKEYE